LLLLLLLLLLLWNPLPLHHRTSGSPHQGAPCRSSPHAALLL